MPQIEVMNESTVLPDAAVQRMLAPFAQQWKDLRAAWGVDPVAFTFVPKRAAPAVGSWWLVFLDDSDQAGALAYHDLTNGGLPISKVFVKTLLADHASISVGATHELCEMAVDPWLNGAYQDPRGTFWAGEVCDPVESDRYGRLIGDVTVSDFITPDWFAHQHSGSRVDLYGYAHRPFEILPGGYAQKWEPRRGWVQVNGAAAMTPHQANAPIGSRRERRRRQHTMIRSAARLS